MYLISILGKKSPLISHNQIYELVRHLESCIKTFNSVGAVHKLHKF